MLFEAIEFWGHLLCSESFEKHTKMDANSDWFQPVILNLRIELGSDPAYVT